MREDIKEILFDEENIMKKVEEISAQISRDYKGKDKLTYEYDNWNLN